MLFFLITTILVLMLIYNALYSFFSPDIQSIKWVRVFAIISGVIILFWGVKQAIQEYSSYRFAYVATKDGTILKKKNVIKNEANKIPAVKTE